MTLNNTQYQYFENSLTIPIPIPKFQHPNTTLIQWEKGRRVVFSTKEDVLPAAGTKRPPLFCRKKLTRWRAFCLRGRLPWRAFCLRGRLSWRAFCPHTVFCVCLGSHPRHKSRIFPVKPYKMQIDEE